MTLPFIAMAGLAEAAFAQGLVISWAPLILIGVLLLAAWVRRSQRISAIAFGLAFLVGEYFQPWNSLVPLPKELAYQLADSDYVDWRARFQFMAISWVVLSVVALLSFLFVRKTSHELRNRFSAQNQSPTEARQ